MIPQHPDRPETLGQRIARLRMTRGWTQEGLAERLAASRVAVSHFELGLALPSERTIVLLAGLFKLEPHELVADTSYPQAKVERLPANVCRYTEIEYQLALLRRDLDWIAHVDDVELCLRVLSEWHMKIAELAKQTYGDDARTLLAQAEEWLQSSSG